MTAWSPEQATELLLSRELFGMKFGLDRMRELLDELDNPQNSFRSIHIVGTNGKSSTARFAGAILAERGLVAGAYVSPHLTGYHERVLLGRGSIKTVEAGVFAAAVERVAAAAARVEARLPEGDLVTQFELVTAAAFVVFADAGVEAVAVEAGLGGRHDATNVLASGSVVLLSSIGLDHTRWLGDNLRSIAAEKLAVVKPGDLLAVASGLDQSVEAEVELAGERSGSAVRIADPEAVAGLEMAAQGSFQSANLALAAVGIELLLGSNDRDAVVRAAATTIVPGRFEVISKGPLTVVDSAHNVEGASRLSESLGDVAAKGPIVCVLGLLDDKDAAGFIAAIIARVDVLIATRPLNPRALDAERVASLAKAAGVARVETQPDHAKALVLAREIALAEGGSVVVTGSVHLIGDVVSAPGERIVTAL